MAAGLQNCAVQQESADLALLLFEIGQSIAPR